MNTQKQTADKWKLPLKGLTRSWLLPPNALQFCDHPLINWLWRRPLGGLALTLRTLNGRAVLVWQCLIPLVVLTTIFTLGRWFAAVHGLAAPEIAQLLWRFEISLVLAWWVRIDRQIRGLSVPFEFDAFVFFAWPLLVPYYLYRTRRARGLLLAAGIYGLLLTPFITGDIARIADLR